MAVDFTWVWCAQFGEAPDYWLSSPGTFEQYGSPSFSCGRQWTVIKTSDFQDIYLASQQGGGSTGSTAQFTETEVAALKWQAANPSPFNLSISDGALVGGAIVATWAVAWGLRQLVQTLGVADGNQQE